MKKILLLFAGLLSLSVSAQTSGSCGANATWSYNEGVLTVSGTGDMADYTDGLTDAPWNAIRASISEVVIGDGITHVGRFAFTNCTGVTSVIIGENVESIGDAAFDNCINAGFTKLNIPNSVKSIGIFAFSNNHLKYICIGSGIKTIGAEAFMMCQDLEYLGCYALTPPTLGNNVFSGTTNLKAIYVAGYAENGFRSAEGWSTYADIIGEPYGNCGEGVGDEVTDAVRWRFDMMTNRLVISGTGAIKAYGPTGYPWNNVAFNPLGGEYNMYWTGIKEIAFNNGVTIIPDWAFAMQTNCASVSLPKSLKTIGASALEECAFTAIDLPEGLESIGDYAFFGSKLTSLILPSTLTSIGNSAFLDNADLATVTSVRTTPPVLGDAEPVFGDGSTLNAIYVPSSAVSTYKSAPGWSAYAAKIKAAPTTTFTYTATEKETDFDSYAYFKGATGVKSHDFANGAGTVVYDGYVTAIGQSALTYTKLTSITIPESVTSIDTYSFQGSDQLTTVIFAGTPAVTTIGKMAFRSCKAMTTFTVPASVKSIEASAFSDCSELTTVNFAGTPTITTIGNAAFQDCKKLSTFTIPASVTTLGTTVFWFAGLTSLNIPAGVTSIGQALTCSCPMTSLTVDAGNTKYADLGCNGIFEKGKNRLVNGCVVTTIPNSIVTIGEEAFWGEEGAFSLVLPESVTTIEDRAFHKASGMTSIIIPSGVTYIDEECFFFCDGMEDVYCYAGVDDITWQGNMQMAFSMKSQKFTKFHVWAADLTAWETKYPDANVTFVGDLSERPSGIIDIISAEQPRMEGWYTIDGKKLAGEPSARGIYIHNGRKTIK